MSFSDDTISQVWAKAPILGPTNEQNGFRKDQCGAWIRWADYGDQESSYGWQIDHIKHTSKGGTDVVSNLRPLHWKNNNRRSDGRLVCVVTSADTKNVEK